MKRYLKIAMVALLPLGGAAACQDFLTGGELDTDPNRPTQATLDQLFLTTQVNTWNFMTGQYPRLICMWMQQCAGTTRQYQSLGVYEIAEATFDGAFSDVYARGGVVDLRQIRDAAMAQEPQDRVYAGVTQVVEAMLVGTLADYFGDVPYTEAVAGLEGGTPANPNPVYDEQLDVYASMQALLDSAIANLESDQGAGPGSDLVYDGDPDLWEELAHTLKARFYLHTAEVDPSAYADALAEVQLGISDPDHNYTAIFENQAGSKNIWFQFIEEQRQGYISPGAYLVELLKSRNDPRLAEYFTPSSGAAGQYFGAEPGESESPRISEFDATRVGAGFDQPIVTFAENALIWAEAAFQTGDEGTALDKLNEARASDGLPALSGLSGAALFQEIMLEKYIQLFQNGEVWADWKRTCIPNLDPALTADIIPARFLYPPEEITANPNVPANPARNDNDPAGSVVPGPGAACLGQ